MKGVFNIMKGVFDIKLSTLRIMKGVFDIMKGVFNINLNVICINKGVFNIMKGVFDIKLSVLSIMKGVFDTTVKQNSTEIKARKGCLILKRSKIPQKSKSERCIWY